MCKVYTNVGDTNSYTMLSDWRSGESNAEPLGKRQGAYQLHLMAPGHLCLRIALYPYLECPNRMWC